MADGPSGARALLGRYFNYANNTISLVGIVITTVSGLSIVVFLVMEAAGNLRNPYVGIFAYILLPMIFLLGLLLIPFGMWRRRRQLVAAGVSKEQRWRYPRLDFNDPHLRRISTVVLLLTAVNALIFGITSLMAVEHMESVEFCGTTCHSLMQPEYTSYQESPHSRVACVECHIGPGASFFVRSKLDGLRQVWHTLRDTYDRPIHSPLLTLRPARETCEQCHWPEKHYGDKIHVFARFRSDEANTPSYTAMLLRTGGGSLDAGNHSGIHWWHINSDNQIRYVSDPTHQEMRWVELVTPDGEVRTYTRDGEDPPAAEFEAEAQLMDCIDCHNRPTHLLETPSNALDQLLQRRPDLVQLPYFKKQALAAIKAEYPTHDEGMAGVRDALLSFYRESYPELVNGADGPVELAAEEAAKVYGRSVFPEMQTSWETHANNIGHEDFPGCFRCHDEELATADGEHVISMDCETCHAFLIEDSPTPPDLGTLSSEG